MRFLGVIIILVGIILFIGNVSGESPTFPFAGFITMVIGGWIYSAGRTRRARKKLIALGGDALSILAGGGSVESAVAHITTGGVSDKMARRFLASAIEAASEQSEERKKLNKLKPDIDRMISKGESNEEIIEMALKQGIDKDLLLKYLREKGRKL